MTGKFHRPTPASVRNAFERDDTPTVFSSRKERGMAQAHGTTRTSTSARNKPNSLRHPIRILGYPSPFDFMRAVGHAI